MRLDDQAHHSTISPFKRPSLLGYPSSMQQCADFVSFSLSLSPKSHYTNMEAAERRDVVSHLTFGPLSRSDI